MSRASDRIASRTAARAASGHDIGTNGWRGEIAGALSATVAMLPFVLSWGFIVYGALGAAGAQVGLTASVIAAVLGSAVMIAASGARLPSATPSASVALVLGAAVITLSRDPAIALSPAGGLPLILAATSAMVCAAGLLVLLLGASGAGRLVRYVPRPVLAGFMDGVAILIVMSQVPLLFGLSAEAWAREGLRALAGWQWPALVASLGTALLMAAIGARWPKAPAALLALVVASLAVAVWRALAAPGSPAANLQQFGAVAIALPDLGALGTWHARATLDELIPHTRLLVTTTLVLALVAAMESVLNLMAVDQRIDARSDPDRELIALGAASVVSGALGGLPLVFMRLRAIVAWNAGARSRRSMWLACAMLALLFALAAPLIERLSTAVIAGIVVMLAVGLFDRWTRQMLHQWRTGRHSAELGWSLGVVALVCAVTLGWGFAAGVLSGTVVAVWVFVRAMDRQLVRARFSAAEFPSRRVYAADEESGLAPLRQHIRVLELEGALFFGSADRLLDECERLPPGTATLIVDLRRVTTVDASGVSALVQLAQRLVERGIRLRLSGVLPHDRHGVALTSHGVDLSGGGGLVDARQPRSRDRSGRAGRARRGHAGTHGAHAAGADAPVRRPRCAPGTGSRRPHGRAPPRGRRAPVRAGRSRRSPVCPDRGIDQRRRRAARPSLRQLLARHVLRRDRGARRRRPHGRCGRGRGEHRSRTADRVLRRAATRRAGAGRAGVPQCRHEPVAALAHRRGSVVARGGLSEGDAGAPIMASGRARRARRKRWLSSIPTAWSPC